MQDKDINTNPVVSNPAAAANAAVGKAVQSDFVRKIVDKIKGSENILIALSRDPSVDELAAAIGLAMFLDGMQKHATAIYSGRTPEAIKFLQPDATFETNTDSLRDFIIALNKEKADHLRYKLEGDFVKVFITPYKTTISEKDLTFSHGDYNVDFVIAINVPSAGNLDEALREHGRIMHDASAVNITTGQPGRFGEIEWSDPGASSLCEMVTDLIFAVQGEGKPLERDVATALLTGIVAATNRFSNERTNSDTMSIASTLMSMGADQQLITSNVKGNEVVHNEEGAALGATAEKPKDKTNLEVEHEEKKAEEVKAGGGAPAADAVGGASVAGVAGAAGVTNPANGNPAAQVAPDVNLASTPEPSKVTATNNVAPENVVVQPVVPGATAPSSVAPSAGAPVVGSTPAGVTDGQMRIPGAPTVLPPVTNAASGAGSATGTMMSSARPMAVSEPDNSGIPQVGNALQPPAPRDDKKKNFAEMMEEALAEPVPMPANPNLVAGSALPDVNALPSMSTGVTAVPLDMGVQSGVMGQPAAGLPTVENTGAAASPAAAPAVNPSATTGQFAVPAMEPVANPMNNAVLPPPPAPVTNGEMMPPVLPQVQVTP